jgi:predicted nucleic acid-binding protein
MPTRVYADTSVFGGVFDLEFARTSKAFFDRVRDGTFELVVSAVVQAEIAPAPKAVRELLDDLLPMADVVRITAGALELRNAYLQAGILTPAWAEDALHVALATLAGCAMIVSWNFKHIVHYRKIPLYNAVNTLRGYGKIEIYSPREVVEDDEETP